MRRGKGPDLERVIMDAKSQEKRASERCYIIWSVPENAYVIVTRMPYFGEWYDAEGIQHGGG